MFIRFLVIAFVFIFRKQLRMNHEPLIKASDVTDDSVITSNEIPLLPPPGEYSGEVRQLTLGESLKLDDLGPIIVNSGNALVPHCKTL
jgi:hypothetical protein